MDNLKNPNWLNDLNNLVLAIRQTNEIQCGVDTMRRNITTSKFSRTQDAYLRPGERKICIYLYTGESKNTETELVVPLAGKYNSTDPREQNQKMIVWFKNITHTQPRPNHTNTRRIQK